MVANNSRGAGGEIAVSCLLGGGDGGSDGSQRSSRACAQLAELGAGEQVIVFLKILLYNFCYTSFVAQNFFTQVLLYKIDIWCLKFCLVMACLFSLILILFSNSCRTNLLCGCFCTQFVRTNYWSKILYVIFFDSNFSFKICYSLFSVQTFASKFC